MHYYKFHIPDWNLATSHLSLEEEAIYFRLVNFYYDTESPIPTETQSVFRRLRLGSQSETAGLVLAEFFVLCDDGWHHKRCDEVINEYQEKAESNRENGKKGGRPPKRGAASRRKNPDGFQKEPNTNPNITLTTNHKPLTNSFIYNDVISEDSGDNAQQEQKEKPTRTSKGSRLDPGLTLPPTWKAWAIDNRPELDPVLAFEKFRDFWIAKAGKDGTKLDWFATWRNWIRNTRGQTNERREFVDNSAPARVKRAIEERQRQRGEILGADEQGGILEGEFERIPF